MRVATTWTAGLSEDAKKSYIDGLVANPYLKVLRTILEVRDKGLQKNEFSTEDFKEHQWAYKQAFRNGQRSAINAIIELLTFEDRHDRSV